MPAPAPQPEPEPEEVQEEQTARQDAAMAGGTPDNTYGHVVLNFNESSTIKLYSGQYIVYCNASTPVLNAIGEPTDGYAQALSYAWAKVELTGEQMKQALLDSHRKLAMQTNNHE